MLQLIQLSFAIKSSLILVLGQVAIGWTIDSPAGTEVTSERWGEPRSRTDSAPAQVGLV